MEAGRELDALVARNKRRGYWILLVDVVLLLLVAVLVVVGRLDPVVGWVLGGLIVMGSCYLEYLFRDMA